MATPSPGYRHLANPRAFEDFLSGGGLLTGRDDLVEEYNYDYRVRKPDFEGHLRSLVLLHTTDYSSAHDLTWAAEEDLLFAATGADFNISVSGYGDATASRPIEPYWIAHVRTDGIRWMRHAHGVGCSTRGAPCR